ncbi:hypothetical protein [Promicromonospora kroppenstedtii]|uniref:hypothetical protein n=1 Tax=Promicromonospora kroppenstedtii TaxID=440482 RepID=UPI0004B2E5EF|nr:hypothetical protein [Promicromonospora kroppenstedtii]
MLRWAGVVHPNPVVYEVHISATSPVVPSAATLAGELAGTTMTVRSFGTPETTLAYGTTYHVALIAKDSVDETFASALGPEASGMPAQVPSAAIDEAVTDAIAEAQSDADAAQLTADGKNTITYGSAAPTSTTPGRPRRHLLGALRLDDHRAVPVHGRHGRAHGQHRGRSDAHQRDHLDARRREGHYGAHSPLPASPRSR